ncbi:MAG: exosortase/archaeosortase family protein [Parvicella sp.]|jgi:exosortase/archaeosortase family protein
MLFNKEIKPGYWFIIKAISLMVLWKVMYYSGFLDSSGINSWLTNRVGGDTSIFFQLIGYDSQFDQSNLVIDGIRSVFIGHPCNGLELHALFLGFIIITPGKLIVKFWYGVLGIALIYGINILRVYLLGTNFINNPSTFEFNHKYTYLGLVYLLVFILWIIWVEVVNKKSLAQAIK